ncbi:hypothetical protein GCM10009613_60730 [Pseudonocardia kongjuensis]|uniref:Uncharacterized protein n=1 Tax=Pseudonocardia kongjuensis TaxID=102227 RepID=A0ABN1YBI5_9PSEU
MSAALVLVASLDDLDQVCRAAGLREIHGRAGSRTWSDDHGSYVDAHADTATGVLRVDITPQRRAGVIPPSLVAWFAAGPTLAAAAVTAAIQDVQNAVAAGGGGR